jgi:chitinase
MLLGVLLATLVASPVPAAASRQLPPAAPLQLSAAIAAAAGTFAGVSTSIAVTSVAQPGISAPADVIVGEADGHVDLVVSLSAPGLSVVSVNYATANSSAIAGLGCNADYVAVNGTLNFAVGELTKVVTVSLFDCAVVKGFRSFTFGLTTPVNSTIARATVRVGIVDNGTVVATPALFVRDATVDEKAGSVSIPVLLGGPSGQASNSTVTVNYATSNAGAIAGTDYTAASGTLTFAPGETVKNVVVDITDDTDTTSEPIERFALTLSSPTNATIADGVGMVVLGANDAAPVAQPSISAPADVIVGEGDGYVDLVVSLSAPGLSAVSVNYATANSSAVAGLSCNLDYVGVSGTLNFAVGETTKVVRVDLFDCAVVKGFISFTLGLTTPVNATIARATVRVGIVDNGTVVATPALFVRDATVDEKAGSASIPVLLGGPSGRASASTVTVNYATSNAGAIAGTDYTATSGTLTFAPGETVKNVVVDITDDTDTTPEPIERFALTLSSPTNATIADGTGIIVIGANDAAPVAQPGISAPADVIVGEADGYVDLVVSLSAPGLSVVSVNYATANSSATSGLSCNLDYVAVSGTLNFAVGETTKVVRVDLLDCAVVKGFRSFTFGLTTPLNATIARATGRVGIVNNNTVVSTPSLFVRDAVVDEKAGSVSIPVLLGGPSGQASNSTVTVNYATSNAGAIAGTDYTATSGTLTFAPGETVKNVVVDITDDTDTTPEPIERFALTLSSPTNATIADGTGIVVIGANDAAPVAQPGISAPADGIVGEGDGYVDLVVSLSAPGLSPVSVNYATANSSAVAGLSCNLDYVGVSGTLNFAVGETAKVVRVDLFDCAVADGSKTFTLGLTTPVNATIARATALVTIVETSIVDTAIVTSIAPSNGPPPGGTTVTITGFFFTGATAVQFGGTAAASFTIISDTQITATSPPGSGAVDVTVTTPGGTSATWSADLFTFVALPEVAVLPAMTNGAYGGYVTAATIQNTGTAAAFIRIAYFDQNGAPVGAGDAISGLPVNASWTVRQDNGNSFPSTGGDAAQAGSAVVSSSQPIAAFVNEFAPGNAGDATSYSGVQVPSGVGATLYAPAIANNAYGGYTTGIGLLNQGSSATDVTITYRDGSGAVVKTQTVTALAAHAYHGLYSGDSVLGLPSGFAGTATITSSAGQALGAIVNETGPGGQFSSYDAVASGSTMLNAPVALNNAFGGYYTGMGIQNTSASAGTVTVTYYDASGTPTVKSFSIPVNGYLGVYQGSATDGPPVGAYTAVIQSTLPLAAIVNEVAPSSTSAQQSTSYNTFSAGSASLNLPLVENAGSDPWNTGEGIMNTGAGSTTVTVTYYNSGTGAAVGTVQTQTLAPNAFWGLYQPSGGLPGGTRATAVITTSAGSQVAVICNESSTTTFMSYDGQ